MALAIVAPLGGKLTEKRRAIEPAVGLKPCQREHRGAKVDEAHHPFVPAPGVATIRVADDQRHPQAGVEARPLATRQAHAVVTEEDHDRVFKAAGFFQVGQLLPDPAVHAGDVVVGAGDGFADRRSVGVERGEWGILRIKHRGRGLSVGEGLALVGAGVVKHGEKGLASGPILPVGVATRLVPNGHRFFELVVLLGVVCAVVAGSSEVLREAASKGRRQAFVAGDVLVGLRVFFDGRRTGRVVAHLHRADAGAEHARDQRRAGWSADRRGGKGVVVDHPFSRQPVEVWRGHRRVAVGPDPGAHVFNGEPDDVGLRVGVCSLCSACCGESRECQTQNRNQMRAWHIPSSFHSSRVSSAPPPLERGFPGMSVANAAAAGRLYCLSLGDACSPVCAGETAVAGLARGSEQCSAPNPVFLKSRDRRPRVRPRLALEQPL